MFIEKEQFECDELFWRFRYFCTTSTRGFIRILI